MNDYTSKMISRFWAKVNKEGSIPAHCPELGQCWEWTAGTNKAGYGTFKIKDKLTALAHRIAFSLYDNDIEGSHVLHKCDNPKCVNPYHLFLGTDLDNAQDRKQKGRNGHSPGEANGRCKLTTNQIIEMKIRKQQGETFRGLARDYGISHRQVKRIVTGESWKGIG